MQTQMVQQMGTGMMQPRPTHIPVAHQAHDMPMHVVTQDPYMANPTYNTAMFRIPTQQAQQSGGGQFPPQPPQQQQQPPQQKSLPARVIKRALLQDPTTNEEVDIMSLATARTTNTNTSSSASSSVHKTHSQEVSFYFLF